MQIADISQWMGRMAPLKADEAPVKAALNQVESASSEKAAEISVTLKNQAYIRYLAHKYTMNKMTLHEWKNFQMEAADMGLIQMKSVLDFAKKIEHKVFHSSSTEILKDKLIESLNLEEIEQEEMPKNRRKPVITFEPKNMVFELDNLLKQPGEYTAKQQLREWHSLVRSISNIESETV